MSPFSPYLGIVAAFVLTILFISISGSVTVERSPVSVAPTASSTLSVVPAITLPPLAAPDLEPRETATTTEPIPKKKSAPIPEPLPKQKVEPPSIPVVAPIPVPLASPWNAALDSSATALRAALVNIICYAPAGSRLRSISGSGVIINEKGIILTNAHIAQNFLLADHNVSCTIRAGSPAVDKYKASLIYIPSAWINANADILTEVNPSGTGEYDFALLAISKSATRDELPPSFPFIQLAVSPSNIGTPVVIASYGAQFLESSQIQSSLFPTVVFGSVKEVYTFVTNSIDVLALGGSAAAQEGSSGGGVADASGELVGMITTSTTKGSTDTRKLDAITASYVRSAYAGETGEAIDLLLATTTAASIAAFAPKIPELESVLTSNL